MKLFLFIFTVILNQKILAQSCRSNAPSNLATIVSTLCSDDGLKMVDQLKAQGFRCENASENTLKRGTLCKGKLGQYSQAVRIYVSPSYKNKSPASINLHFHGHRLSGTDTFQINASDTSGHGDYGARLVESKSADLLVIPESAGNCTTYDTELNDQAETQSFIKALEQATGLSQARYKLTAHSGGARILNKILLNGSLDGRVKAVGLFDAIYEEQAGVKKYLQASRDHQVVVSYLENGSTQKMTNHFKATTKDWQSQIEMLSVSPAKSSHMSIMNQGAFSLHLAR